MQVNCLESENALLENRQKELKETINNLLQSRESFVKAYEVCSVCLALACKNLARASCTCYSKVLRFCSIYRLNRIED